MPTTATPENTAAATATVDVFDVANWIDRAQAAPSSPANEYVPRHRAEGPAL